MPNSLSVYITFGSMPICVSYMNAWLHDLVSLYTTIHEDIYTLNVTAFDTMAMKWIVVCRIQLQSKLRVHMLCASDRQAYRIQLQSKLRMHMLCASDRQAHDNKTQCRTTTCIPK